MACNVLPALDPGAHFAVSLQYPGFHPLNPLLDDLAHGLALFHLLHLVLAQRLRDGRAALGLEAVDLAAGNLDREGLGVIDAEPRGALLAGFGAGELVIEGRHPGSGDADVETLAFAVVGFGPLIDPCSAQAVGQDDATLAPALANRCKRFSDGDRLNRISRDGV